MKQCNWGRDVLLVEVPDDATVVIPSWGKRHRIQYQYWTGESMRGKIKRFNIFLPPGNWQFAFPEPLNPTEQEAAEWVERQRGSGYFREYSMSGSSLNLYGDYYLSTALESLHSRIRSEGFIHPERVVQLIKK